MEYKPHKIVWWDQDGRYHLIGDWTWWNKHQMRELNRMQSCAMEAIATGKLLDEARKMVEKQGLENSFIRIDF